MMRQKSLDLCLTTGVDASKAGEIFGKIKMENGIPWNNRTAFGVDNPNIGTKNSLKSRLILLFILLDVLAT